MTETGYLVRRIVAGSSDEARASLIGLFDRAVAQTKRVERALPIDPKFYGSMDCAEMELLLESLRGAQKPPVHATP